MKVFRRGTMAWFLKDEGLIDVLEQFYHPESGRRHYAVFEYKGRKIFIKSFLEKGLYGSLRNKISPRGNKEYQLGEKLSALGIHTPEVLGYGIGKRNSCVIQEWIDGNSLINILNSCREPGAIGRELKNSGLFYKLANLLKTLKNHCIRHNDLHLDNILVKNGELYLIDLHKTKIQRSFAVEDEISNLSHALSMVYDDMAEDERDNFLQLYGAPDLKNHIEAELKRLRERWVKKKAERAFSNTSKIVSNRGYIYIAGMEKQAEGEFVASVKEDKKVRVERYSNHIRKIYRNKRRLEKAWRNHVVLTYLNLFITPQAYCLKIPVSFKEGYIAMEDLKDKGEELDRYLDRNYDGMRSSEKRVFIEKLSQFFNTFLRMGIVHKDLKGCNIFALHNGSFMLLDIEDLMFKGVNDEAMKRMLIQLNTTIPKRIHMKERIRFFLKLSAFIKADRRQVLKDVARESLKGEIVYEGAGGLKVESW